MTTKPPALEMPKTIFTRWQWKSQVNPMVMIYSTYEKSDISSNNSYKKRAVW